MKEPAADPDVSALTRQAEAFLSAGQYDSAARACRAVLAAEPDNARALMIASALCVAQGRLDEAETLVIRGCLAHPASVEFQVALGRLRLQARRFGDAVEPFENCVLMQPDNRDHRATLLGLYQARLFTTFSERSKLAMLACLKDDALTHGLLHKAWLSLLRLDPESQPMLQLFQSTDYAAFSDTLTFESLQAIEENRFLVEGLRRFLVADLVVERGLTWTRRWFGEHRDAAGRHLSLVCTLARYCFFSEYVFACDEGTPVWALQPHSASDVAVLASYEPLYARAGAEQLVSLSEEPCYLELLRVQLLEPLQESVIRSTIAEGTPLADEVSRAVQQQYEENPYPRWITVGRQAPPADVQALAEGRHILVAGCGTGREAVEAALLFPAAQIDAVDLSRSSLAYAIRKSLELGTSNLTFQHADLLELGSWQQRFDLIVCSGVLHHLREPQKGIAVLLGRLRTGGVLRLGLYSTIARREIHAARAWIQKEGFPASATGIRAFRARVAALGNEDPLKKQLALSYDFYALSSCRDLLFHVQEHTFTLLQIADIARDNGLSVIRVDTKSPAHALAYRERFPGDPRAVNLANWHALELEHPTMFAGMYSLWFARRGERPDLGWLGALTHG